MKWRVYALKHPSDLSGDPYSGHPKHRRSGGWFWIRNGISLWIRVRGLNNARYVCRALNKVEGL